MPHYIQNSPKTKIQGQPSTMALPEITSSAEVGLVVDQSGSMQSLAAQLVESFNTLLNDQKSIADVNGSPPIVSLSLFNHSVTSLYDAVPAADVPPLSHAVYFPAGSTALNDAIGTMIHQIGKRTRRSTRVLVAILTDGEENSSRSFSTDDILHMISYRRLNYDWQFIFIGPQNAIDYGLKIGIQQSNIVPWDADPDSLRLLMVRLSKSIKAYQLGDRKYALMLRN